MKKSEFFAWLMTSGAVVLPPLAQMAHAQPELNSLASAYANRPATLQDLAQTTAGGVVGSQSFNGPNSMGVPYASVTNKPTWNNGSCTAAGNANAVVTGTDTEGMLISIGTSCISGLGTLTFTIAANNGWACSGFNQTHTLISVGEFTYGPTLAIIQAYTGATTTSTFNASDTLILSCSPF